LRVLNLDRVQGTASIKRGTPAAVAASARASLTGFFPKDPLATNTTVLHCACGAGEGPGRISSWAREFADRQATSSATHKAMRLIGLPFGKVGGLLLEMLVTERVPS
jgi:hypothetical protein